MPLDIRQSDKQGALDQRLFFFAFSRLQKPIAAKPGDQIDSVEILPSSPTASVYAARPLLAISMASIPKMREGELSDP